MDRTENRGKEGISVRWETYLTYYIDDVEVEVFEPFF